MYSDKEKTGVLKAFDSDTLAQAMSALVMHQEGLYAPLKLACKVTKERQVNKLSLLSMARRGWEVELSVFSHALIQLFCRCLLVMSMLWTRQKQRYTATGTHVWQVYLVSEILPVCGVEATDGGEAKPG